MLSIVPLFLRKPLCIGDSSGFFSRNHDSREWIILSVILHKQEVKATDDTTRAPLGL